MAIDRQGLIGATYKGAGILPRALGNPGTWGYAQDVFSAGLERAARTDAATSTTAKALVKDAGAEGKTIKLGMSAASCRPR